MSSSIPIHPRGPSALSPSLSSPPSTLLGTSLPSRHSLYTPKSPAPALAVRSSQDDLATIAWPPRPSVELVSRAARKWQNGSRSSISASRAPRKTTRFDPWDFSEIAAASAEVKTAFHNGSARAERPPREGVSGTYFIRRNESRGAVLCVFKPVDEEATDIEMSPTTIPLAYSAGSPGIPSDLDFSLGPAFGVTSPNPRSPGVGHTFARTASLSSDSEFDSRFSRASGFYPGEGAYKEVAAYLLDHDRFARVPQTALAMCNFSSEIPEKNVNEHNAPSRRSFSSDTGEPYYSEEDFVVDGDSVPGAEEEEEEDGSHLRTKMGAFQVYVENVGDADDYGPGVFDRDQVHRIAILDVRTLNHDRHGGNILVTRSNSSNRRYDLVPIDHGYILPDVVQSVPWPVWMDWPMIREPLSERAKAYIGCLDADSEAHILYEELDGKLRGGSLRALKVATMLLQKGVAAGLTLYDIGLLIYTRREDPYSKSELEKIMIEAEEAGSARERHLAEEVNELKKGSGEQPIHRRHQSMSAINVHESYIEDYIVKYAGRRIQNVVARVAAQKEEEGASTTPDRKVGRGLSRARSIPEFGGLGIGAKPLHTLLIQADMPRLEMPRLVPTNSPVTSPMPVPSGNRFGAHSLEAQLPQYSQTAIRAPPIQIPINDGSIDRIAIPELVGSTLDDIPFESGVGTRGPEKSRAGRDVPSVNLSSLSPLFKEERKSSPVAPIDMMMWETGSS
ncbi:Phosphatidylinositol 4-kinase gamma 4 [Gracilariopsis chorda]|uniref:Phosphatidylinositol 4-kinase gamma 4 n=1 Tax=Gracilariopsis chorda TaxID=448386 RepID=A0A2V3J2M5_9FLOR|nr:Phosphatidylinositol 4-kinase gamma 4 [Gracilariopsis chorda]|eukprot:PXF48629.1 Phosphatidylinositol 4-kinase gamma 4 [Gracilariopsis chorda]